MKPIPPPKTRADVEALPLPLAATAVLHFLLERPARVYERAEIAAALGAKPSDVEVELVRMQRRPPVLLARQGPDGNGIRGRHGYIPADDPLRAAWAKPTFIEGAAVDVPIGDQSHAFKFTVTDVSPLPPITPEMVGVPAAVTQQAPIDVIDAALASTLPILDGKPPTGPRPKSKPIHIPREKRHDEEK